MNVHREVVYKLRRKILEFKENVGDNEEWILSRLIEHTDLGHEDWEDRKKQFGEDIWRQIVSDFGLPVVDMLWMDHLIDMEQLRTGIGLRGYAQRDPMVEYKKEGHQRFEILVKRIYTDLADRLLKIDLDAKPHEQQASVLQQMARNASYQFSELESGVADEAAKMENPVVKDDIGRDIKVEKVKSSKDKPGRNDPCWCGSGKKYKKCHYPN
jgi:preprotein translocase subunit SecA